MRAKIVAINFGVWPAKSDFQKPTALYLEGGEEVKVDAVDWAKEPDGAQIGDWFLRNDDSAVCSIFTFRPGGFNLIDDIDAMRDLIPDGPRAMEMAPDNRKLVDEFNATLRSDPALAPFAMTAAEILQRKREAGTLQHLEDQPIRILADGTIAPDGEGHFGFSSALAWLKAGCRVARSGWNGRGMWLRMIPASEWHLMEVNVDGAKLASFIGMRTVDHSFVPWLASQTDLLAEDWKVV